MDETLNRFIGEAIGGGFEKSEIERILIEAGWPQDEVRKGLTAFADVDFPIPVPRPKAYLSAREAFLYLVPLLSGRTVAIGFTSVCIHLT
jgi:hypothetical protein